MRFRVCLCGKGIACPLKNVDEIQFLITQFRSETRDFQIKWDADQNVALERRVPFVMKIRFDTAENELSQFFSAGVLLVVLRNLIIKFLESPSQFVGKMILLVMEFLKSERRNYFSGCKVS